jgi:hypothetical protein
MKRTFGENAKVTPLAGGSFVNTTAGGTGAPVFAGDYSYHAIVFTGTIGNVGTLFAYAHTTATGGGTTAIGSIVFGSSNVGAVIYEVATPVLTGIGTLYQFISGQIKVEAGGTLGGGLAVISTNPVSAPTSSGSWAAFGSQYS